MSAHEMGNTGPLSRRGFLGQSAALALAAGTAGCSSNSKQPPKLGILKGGEDSTAKGGGDNPIQGQGRFRDSQPAISYAEGMAAVRKFRKDHVPKLMPDSPVHRVQFMTVGGDENGDGTGTFIEVIAVDAKVELPQTFSYRPPGGKDDKTVPVKLTIRDPAVPQVRLGHPARVSTLPSTANGTAGWNICAVIRGVEKVVCMTARHALCANFFTPVLNLTVLLNDQPWGKVERVEDIDPASGSNMFDLGLARYNNPELVAEGAEKLNRQCQAGYPQGSSPYGYPMSIKPASNVATGQAYHKVGAASPICNEGGLNHYLDAYCDVSVPYMNGAVQQYVSFTGCLVFGALCKPGDSGAVLADNTDWSALGLHFAGTPGTDSVSCPLFNLNWTRDPNNYNLFVPSTGKTRIIPRFVLP